MSEIKYQNSAPIEPRQYTVWMIELQDKSKRIAIWYKDATIEEVHSYCKVHYSEFKLGRLDVGEYIIDCVDHSYRSDSRYVDQDWNVIIDWGAE